MNITACTVTLRGRVAFAEVLASSFLSVHPGARFFSLILDPAPDQPPLLPSGASAVKPQDIGLSQQELSQMMVLYDRPALFWASASHLLSHVIKSTAGPAAYFADDVVVLGDCFRAFSLAAENGLVVTRRTRSAFPSDGRTPDQNQLLDAGTYDPGFMAADETAFDFLACLSSETSVEAMIRREVGDGPFWFDIDTDPPAPGQWLDLGTSWFSHFEWNDPGACVSFWNVFDRSIDQRDGKYAVGGAPLMFFRFEDYDPERDYLISMAQGRKPRVLLSQRSDLMKFTSDYRTNLAGRGLLEDLKLPSPLASLPGGIKIDNRIRTVYREALNKALLGQGDPPPDPFGAPDAFLEWLKSPDPSNRATRISRYLLSLYRDRPDLRAAFPGIAGADADNLLHWASTHGVKEEAVPQELVSADSESTGISAASEQNSPEPEALPEGRETVPVTELPLPEGINLIGYLSSELGVGQGARLLLEGLKESGIAYSTHSYGATYSRQNYPFQPEGPALGFNTNLICVNADQFPTFVKELGERTFEHRYNIGLWWWEVEPLPPRMAVAADFLDEIWVGSDHVLRLVSAATDKPVHVVPIPIRKITAEPLAREILGVPDRFMFLFTFDFFSTVERKNPMGLIEAFKRAFSSGEGPILVIKGINGEHFPIQLERLQVAAAGRPDIFFITEYFSSQDQDALIAGCDCFVSLHRAEGLGLGMAEAMALGKPVIATGYSGNLSFMDASNSYLVDYRMGKVPATETLYPPGGVWAEPNLDSAAAHMRTVFDRPDEARARAQKGSSDILRLHTPSDTAAFIQARMAEIQAARATQLPQAPLSRVRAGLSRLRGGLKREAMS